MTSPTMADYDLFYMGGIAGKVAGAFTLKNCINRGNLTAAVERDIAVTTMPCSTVARTTATLR